jgi:hypothetical protein
MCVDSGTVGLGGNGTVDVVEVEGVVVRVSSGPGVGVSRFGFTETI